MIALLTDFGQSEYVGVMKGVIYSISHNAKVVDLCNDIRPQCVIEASWILKNNFKFFPKGTVFCCVVDPGVGTKRKALAVKTRDYYFVAPDNGLLWETLRQQRTLEIRQIPMPREASSTFHGRDVFAKAAARVELGEFASAGPKTRGIRKLQLHRSKTQGTIVRIDRFGNIITNLPVRGKKSYVVKIGRRIYQMRFCRTYSAARQGRLFLILGSNNTLEISLKNASANEQLQAAVGDRIRIY
jgi:S-adenosylmethionine hydrolase